MENTIQENGLNMKSVTGIDATASVDLVKEMNQLLADYHVYYQNLRGFHWNISGPGFFELHRHFEELYTATQVVIDDLAERILTLGGKPLHTMTDFVAKSNIQEARNLYTAEDTVKATLKNLEILLIKEREIVKLAGEAGDDGTDDMLTPLIASQEKDAWMLKAYLGKK